MIDVFAGTAQHPDVIAGHLAAAGLEPLDGRFHHTFTKTFAVARRRP